MPKPGRKSAPKPTIPYPKDYRIKVVKVAVVYDDKTKSKEGRRVWLKGKGFLAIDEKATGREGMYTLVHVKTGFLIASLADKAEALELAETLDKEFWSLLRYSDPDEVLRNCPKWFAAWMGDVNRHRRLLPREGYVEAHEEE